MKIKALIGHDNFTQPDFKRPSILSAILLNPDFRFQHVSVYYHQPRAPQVQETHLLHIDKPHPQFNFG